jgi:hypothetical protein
MIPRNQFIISTLNKRVYGNFNEHIWGIRGRLVGSGITKGAHGGFGQTLECACVVTMTSLLCNVWFLKKKWETQQKGSQPEAALREPPLPVVLLFCFFIF